MPFIDKYNWKEINFPSHKKDWEKFESKISQFLLICCMYLIILKNKTCI